MPWVPVLLLLAVVYVVLLVVRGLIQFVPWFTEEFIDPRRRVRLKDDSRRSLHGAGSGGSPVPAHHRQPHGHLGYAERLAIGALRVLDTLLRPLQFLRQLSTRKDFAYWVGLALSENDPGKKVKCLSNALALNPDYEPAWGLKAIALVELKRYEEATACFDRVLAIHADPIAWCKKGLCCYHLGKYQAAVACFDETLAGAGKDHELFDEAASHKKLAEEALRQQTAKRPE